MYRWLRFMIVRRAFLVLLMICLGCSAQAPPSATTSSTPNASSDLTEVIERHVRAQYQLPPDVKVTLGPLRASEFPNYDALTVTFSSATKKIDVSGRPTRGNKDAKVTVVNYDDFECPFCARMHSTLFPGLFKEYGDRVLFIYKDFPLEEIHPWAVHAAIDANCLAAQNNDAYWDYADYLHGNQSVVSEAKGRDGQNSELDKLATLQGQKHNLDVPKLQACVKLQDEKAVRASMHEADTIGVEATPTMYVNGRKLDGAVPEDEVRLALDQALKDAGLAPPEHKN